MERIEQIRALVASPQWQQDVAEAEAAIEAGDVGEPVTMEQLRALLAERSAVVHADDPPERNSGDSGASGGQP